MDGKLSWGVKAVKKKCDDKNTSKKNQTFKYFSNNKNIVKKKSIIYYLYKDFYFSFVNYLVKYLIISYLIVSINLTTFELVKIYSSSSIITIKIIGPGIKSIVSAEFPNKSPKLSYVHINNINQENINNKYDFPEIENTVKLT